LLNIINDVNELRKIIETKACHPYLQKHIEKPFVDEDKLLLLWGLFNELEISSDERNHYILSTMLVQIALDTHEKVSNTNVSRDSSDLVKNRQLMVLAGDYYSGLYYQVLSEVGNIDMIRSLSSAVKEMNDHKILLYQYTLNSKAAFLSSVKAVEASLIYKIAEYFQKPIWMNAAENILLLKRLYVEKEQYMATGQSILLEGIRMMLFPSLKRDVLLSKEQKSQIENMMNSCIKYAIQSVKESKAELPIANVELHQRIHDILSLQNLKRIHM
jgi:heptaprenyl diphosphate synthase